MSKADEMISTEFHNLNGKRQPVQVMKCTRKGCRSRFRTSKPTTPDAVVHKAREKGWNINLANKTAVCPEHRDESKPREMSKDQKRAIWREIDDNYERDRYVPGVTDKSIGEKLKFPWAWVKQVREEDFGVGVAGLVVTRGQRAPVVQREVALKGVALAVVEREGQDAGLQARGGFDSCSVQVRCGRLASFAPLQQEQGRLRLRRDDEGVGFVWISQVAVELRFRFLLR